MEGQYAQSLMEAAIIPAVTGFAICAAVLVIGVLHPVARPRPWRSPTDRATFLRRTTTLLGLGYGAFLTIVLLYSHLLQHEPTALSSALWGIPFLMALTMPCWLGLSWVASAVNRHRHQ